MRLEKRIVTMSETLTSWVGELLADQETYIRERIKDIPHAAEVWLANRRSRQEKLLELLRSSHDPCMLEQGLYQWLADSKTGATDEYLVVSREWSAEVEKVV